MVAGRQAAVAQERKAGSSHSTFPLFSNRLPLLGSFGPTVPGSPAQLQQIAEDIVDLRALLSILVDSDFDRVAVLV